MTPAKFILAMYLFYEWVLWVPSGWIAILFVYCMYKLYRRSPKWKLYAQNSPMYGAASVERPTT
jgi:hypothetical protein